MQKRPLKFIGMCNCTVFTSQYHQDDRDNLQSDPTAATIISPSLSDDVSQAGTSGRMGSENWGLASL